MEEPHEERGLNVVLEFHVVTEFHVVMEFQDDEEQHGVKVGQFYHFVHLHVLKMMRRTPAFQSDVLNYVVLLAVALQEVQSDGHL